MQNSSDEDVLAALQAGQMSALDVLYGRYAKQVYSLAYRILNNSEEAEDVTQEVFLALMKKNVYQSTRGSIKSFLTTMARSRSIDKLRHQTSRQHFVQRWQRLSAADHETSPPLEEVWVNERLSLIQQALSELSDSEREILEIAYYEGRTQAEIAQQLGLPLGTVKSRSRQALIKLRQRLQHSL